MGYVSFVVCCVLMCVVVVCRVSFVWLGVDCCVLSVGCWLSFVVCGLLCVASCVLFVVCCVLVVVSCLPFVGCGALFACCCLSYLLIVRCIWQLRVCRSLCVT